jgi:hypothetical protein
MDSESDSEERLGGDDVCLFVCVRYYMYNKQKHQLSSHVFLNVVSDQSHIRIVFKLLEYNSDM